MYSTKRITIPILLLALVTLGCGFSVTLKDGGYNTGAMTTEPINVPFPEQSEGQVDLTIQFGGGKLTVGPGAAEALITGNATYNVAELKPKVLVEGNTVTLSQLDKEIRVPARLGSDVRNVWDLKLASSPIDLTIKAGGYQGDLELGGLALKSLHIAEGASDSRVSFSEPNQAEMDTFRFETGASKV